MLRSIRTFSAAVRRVAVRPRVPSRITVTLIATSAFAATASTNVVVPGRARCLAESNDDLNDNPVIPSYPQVEGARKPSEMESIFGITFLWNALKHRIQSMHKHHKEKRQQENTEEDGAAEVLKRVQNERDEDDVPAPLPPIAATEGNSRHNGPR
jgi:hypothetical protein